MRLNDLQLGLAAVTAEQRLEAVLWFVGLMVGLGGGIVVYFWMRRRFFGAARDEPTDLTLEEATRMRSEGTITESEYRALRDAIIGRLSS